MTRATEVANGQDIRLGGGVATIRQYLRAALIDEMHLAISPVLLGSGEHLLTGIDAPKLGYQCTEHVATANATHVVLQGVARRRRLWRPAETARRRALLDARAVSKWKVPTGMTCHVHEFDAREGGSFRISLTYEAPTATGKTTPHTDTYHGRFVKLVPNAQVVEVD